jgi:acyl-coenzyme A synthetase/AMP-(fatty) acid ligase
MSISAKALLSRDLRAQLADDSSLGVGNLLRRAIEVNPHPDAPFLESGRPLINSDGEEQTEFSLVDIDRLVQSWAVWYLEQGVRPRDRVAVFFQDSFAYSIHVHALARIGAIAVLLNSNVTKETALALARQTGPIGLYIDRARLDRIDGDVGMLDDLRWIQLVEELPAPPSAALPEEARFKHVDDDPVVILYSSGTTGLPKPIIHSHASLAAGPRWRLVNFTERPGSLMMAAQPQSHVGAIVYALYAVVAATPIVPLYDPTGPELVSAIVRYRPTMVLAFAHAYSDLAALDVPEGALDSVEGWISLADAVHEAHMKEILRRRSKGLPEATFYDRFGSSELGWGLMVQRRSLSTERSDRRMGTPDSLAEFAVLREDGTKAATGEFGLIGVKTPTVTLGYWGDPDLTYRSQLGGYWLSGDVGYQDENGTYFHVDRVVDMIETDSGTGYSVLMEEVLLAEVLDILDCAVVAGKHHGRTVPVAVITTSGEAGDPDEILRAANAALRSTGHPELALLEVVATDDDLPVGFTGKVLKSRLRHKYRSLEQYLAESDGKSLATSISPQDSRELLPT